MLLVPHCC